MSFVEVAVLGRFDLTFRNHTQLILDQRCDVNNKLNIFMNLLALYMVITSKPNDITILVLPGDKYFTLHNQK